MHLGPLFAQLLDQGSNSGARIVPTPLLAQDPKQFCLARGITVAHRPCRSRWIAIPGRRQVDLGSGFIDFQESALAVAARIPLENIVGMQEDAATAGASGSDPNPLAAQTAATLPQDIVEKMNQIHPDDRTTEGFSKWGQQSLLYFRSRP